MKLFCESLVMGLCAAGSYGLTCEWLGTDEKTFSWWILYLFLILIAFSCIKYITKPETNYW